MRAELLGDIASCLTTLSSPLFLPLCVSLRVLLALHANSSVTKTLSSTCLG